MSSDLSFDVYNLCMDAPGKYSVFWNSALSFAPFLAGTKRKGEVGSTGLL